MALGFSGGLLTGLQQFGQGGGAMPSDPRQRNAIQAAGVTNPLLQRFGMGLGGILGTEMRSPMEQFGSAIQGIDTSTPEGKKALITALAKVDPISAVKMGEAFRQEALDAPKREAELLRINAQTEAAKAQTERRNISFQATVPERHPITGEITGYKLQQFTTTQVKDSEGNWVIPEGVRGDFEKIGITNEKVNSAAEQETIEYFIDDKGKQRVISYKEGKTFDVTGGEPVEIAPEVVEKWRGVGEIKTEAELPTPSPTPSPTPAARATPSPTVSQRTEEILRQKNGMLTNPIFAPYMNR